MRPTTPGTCGDDLERRWQAIRERMMAEADWLVRRGTLVAKQARGRRVWVVRFATPGEHGPVHRSISIGDHPELVQRTRELLRLCRGRQRWPLEVASAARFVATAQSLLRRSLGRKAEGLSGPVIDV